MKPLDASKSLRRQGVVQKYYVDRVDGANDDPTSKHFNKDYFVLDPIDDPFARVALKAYIEACKDEYPYLAHDLKQMLEVE